MIPAPLATLAMTVLLLAAPALLLAAPEDKGARKSAARAAAAASASASSTAAAEPAGVAVDPMERLRQRLAQRLAVPGAAPVSGTVDLQVGTRAASASPPRKAGRPDGGPDGAQAAAPAHAQGPARARSQIAAPMHNAGATSGLAAAPAAAATVQRRSPAAAHLAARNGQAPHAHWGYEGALGPAAWGGLRPDFNLCASGQRQSPIDLRAGFAVDLEPVKFDYRPSPFAVIDNGHTVQANLAPGNAIELGGRRYELVQFHFHRPSEERIDGRQFEMSLHLVHKDAAGKLAVVAVLLGKGPAHPAVQAVWNSLPLEKNEEQPSRTPLDPGHLLPEDRRYYTYMGSLTTPPCSEGVLWVVMRTPVTVTPEQIELFARIYPMNARPAQPVAGRRIMQSQ